MKYRLFMLLLQLLLICYILFFGDDRARVLAALILPMWALSFNHNIIKRSTNKGEKNDKKS